MKVANPIHISRDASLSSLQLSPIRINGDNENPILGAKATGFFWEKNSKWYLVTNLHVVTGWNFERQCSLSNTGFSPTHLEFIFSVDCNEESAPNDANLLKRVGKRVDLCEFGAPSWLVHPLHAYAVDVAVIELFVNPEKEDIRSDLGGRSIITIPINKLELDNLYHPRVADEAFVVGFPKGMHAQGFPIWKRASIATEPSIDLNALPKILIDTATRQGMSGSPVFARANGVFSPDGVLSKDSIIGEVTNFLGVYSGRIGEDELGVQLGIVWKAQVIDDIIDGGVRGTNPWKTTS